MPRIKEFAINSSMVLASLLVGLLLLEFVVFRFVLLASDVPRNAFMNGLIRYAPFQSGVWRLRDEIAAPYAINKQGWNSNVDDYAVTRTSGVMRVAVVGDSMVEALQVPHDRSITERLVGELSHAGRRVEAYRFAISGAPLSQYLHMIEREVILYNPDWIVVVLIHNDFDESFRFIQGRYTSSFLKLRLADGKVADEIPPTPWQTDTSEWVRLTAIARYVYYRWQFRPAQLRNLFMRLAHADTGPYDANIDVEAVLRQTSDITIATDYIFGRLIALARQHGTRLLLAMDGARVSIYSGRTSAALALALNRLSAELARKHDIPFVDLQPVFQAEWSTNQRSFEFASDGHWNEYGHAVAARAVARAIEALP